MSAQSEGHDFENPFGPHQFTAWRHLTQLTVSVQPCSNPRRWLVVANAEAPPSDSGRRAPAATNALSEPSRSATAYRFSPGTGRSFIRPTFGIAADALWASSKSRRHSPNSDAVRLAA